MEATVAHLNMTTSNGAGKPPNKRNHDDKNNAKKPAAISRAKKLPPASIPVPTLVLSTSDPQDDKKPAAVDKNKTKSTTGNHPPYASLSFSSTAGSPPSHPP
jgi:hypothetical protein